MKTIKEQIDKQVFDGIIKTINRFREKPFHYFTEADIHSSLLNDIMTGAPDVLSVKENNISISLVHQEYPTHFRYIKNDLLHEYKDSNDKIKEKSKLDIKENGHRGHFDLSILNPEFIKKMFAEKIDPIEEKNKRYNDVRHKLAFNHFHFLHHNKEEQLKTRKKDMLLSLHPYKND